MRIPNPPRILVTIVVVAFVYDSIWKYFGTELNWIRDAYVDPLIEEYVEPIYDEYVFPLVDNRKVIPGDGI